MGMRVGTLRNKKARTGRASWGVSGHVGTCGNLHLVEPGGFESKDTNTQLKSAFQALGLEKLICRISLSRLAV